MSEEEILPILNTIQPIKEKKEKKPKEKKQKEPKEKKQKEPKEKKQKEGSRERSSLQDYNERPLVLKVSEKKAISIYGMNRFPITLYKDQMIRLLEHSQEIYNFIEKNESVLATKKMK